MKKQYEVIKAVRSNLTVEIDKKKMPFGKYNAFRVKDPGIANAIRDKYKGRVTVTGINATHVEERKLHKSKVVSPGMPWHKYDELGRIVRKEKENAL